MTQVKTISALGYRFSRLNQPAPEGRAAAFWHRASFGFTIIEILLVLALMTGIMTLFVANVGMVFRDQNEVTVEYAFWTASRETRLQAMLSKRPVSLRYDEEKGAFVMEMDGSVLRAFPARGTTADGREISIQFVQERPRTELVVVRGRLIDTRPIGHVVFYPDGTCTSFWLEIAWGGERHQIRIDPWTGAEMLTLTN